MNWIKTTTFLVLSFIIVGCQSPNDKIIGASQSGLPQWQATTTPESGSPVIDAIKPRNGRDVYIPGHATVTQALTLGNLSGSGEDLKIDANGLLFRGTDANSGVGGGSGNVATSTAETSGQVPYWTSTAATPATLGSDGAFLWDSVLNKLTVTNASTTDLTVGGNIQVDGVVSGAGFTNFWDSQFSATTTWASFAANFNSLFNATSTFGGNAQTATALAANGSNCSAGSFPLGVNAAGASEDCTDAWTEAENTSAAYVNSSGVGDYINASTTIQTIFANANTAFGWGNHAIQNYLDKDTDTYVETESDPVWIADPIYTDHRFATLNASTTLMTSASTTDTLYVGGYASSTAGLFTQGNLHVGGTASFDGLISGLGFTTAWNTLHNATSTYPGFQTQFDTALNATTTLDLTTLSVTNLISSNVTITGGTITGITDLVVADGGTGVSTLTDGGVLFGNGTGAIQASAVLTNGQLLIGDGTTEPTLAVLSEGNGITVANGAGSITLSVDTADNFFFTGETVFNNASTTATGNFNIGGNATSSGFLVVGTTLPPQNPLPVGSLYVGGNATTTGNLTIGPNINPFLYLRDSRDGTFAAGNSIGGLQFMSADTSGSLQNTIRAGINAVTENTIGNIYGLAFSTEFVSTYSEKMRISALGNIGIATTTPGGTWGEKLAVVGTVLIDSASNTQGIRLQGLSEAVEVGDIYMAATGPMVLTTVGGTGANSRIDLAPEDNNWGVRIMESDGTGGSQGAVYANFYVVDAANDYLNIRTTQVQSSSAGLFVSSNDSIGIATSTPGGYYNEKLTVNGGTLMFGSATTTGNLSVLGNATTTGWLNIGTKNNGWTLGAGDLFVSGNATTTGNLTVGSDKVIGKETKCMNVENLQASDDDVLLFSALQAVTITNASCRTTGFSTQPSIAFQDDAGNAMTGAPTCNTTGTWVAVTAGNQLVANEELMFDTTNTPDPTSATQALICFAYTYD